MKRSGAAPCAKQAAAMIAVFSAYMITLALAAVGGAAGPEWLWAFSAGSFLGAGWRWGMLWFGIVWAVLSLWISGRLGLTAELAAEGNRFAESNSGKSFSGSRETVIVLGWIGLLGVLFVVLRARAHFLGDGYEMLSTFGSANPILKTRALGESWIHLWVRDLLGGPTAGAATASFRILSVAAGIVYSLAVWLASRRLIEGGWRRILFVAAATSPGWMLLFFGYVELYSLFVASVGVFALAGLLIAEGRIGRGWIFAALALSMILHVMGAVLIPAAVYVAAAGTRSGDRIGRLSRSVKAALGALVVLAGAGAFWYAQGHSFFFRLAFLAPVADRFTVDSYTLFSVAHIRDVVNLLLLLSPGVLVAVSAWAGGRRHTGFRGRGISFLIILAISQWGAAFLFDPKLGMPRDWDLFAFAGVSAVLLGVYPLVKSKTWGRTAAAAVLLMIGLQVMVLGGRAALQTMPRQSAEQFRRHIEWEPKKHQTSWTILVTYYQNRGDSARAQEAFERYLAQYPGYEKNREGLLLLQNGRTEEALAIFREVMHDNPLFVPSYGNLGAAYFRLNYPDSAELYLDIAHGMNPYNPAVNASRGQLCWTRGEFEEAAALFQDALAVDTAQPQALVGMAAYSRKMNDREEYFRYFRRYLAVAGTGGTPPARLAELGEYLCSQGEREQGLEYLRAAIAGGLDSVAVTRLRGRYLELGR